MSEAHPVTAPPPGMDAGLSNADIAPVPLAERDWKAVSFFALWVGMAINIPSYMIAATLVEGGMSWQQAMLTVLLGNVIVLVPMALSGHAGTKYGIPFPVFARASFGINGAHIPSLLRAIVACGWFGIQTWIGGAAIYTIVLIGFPGIAETPALMPAWVGVHWAQFACFLVFWAMNIALIWRGINSIRVLEHLAAPFLLLCGVALLAWAWVQADGFGPMLQARSELTSDLFLELFFPSLTAMVGFWATLTLNISDFTRYARDQRAQVLGQLSGLPTTMTLFAFIGVAVTSATIVIFGEAIWDPVVLVRRFDSPLLVFFAMVAVVIATLSTNAAANVVGPANSFSNLWPSRIDFKRGGYITGVEVAGGSHRLRLHLADRLLGPARPGDRHHPGGLLPGAQNRTPRHRPVPPRRPLCRSQRPGRAGPAAGRVAECSGLPGAGGPGGRRRLAGEFVRLCLVHRPGHRQRGLLDPDARPGRGGRSAQA
jgi:NCS1 family nucleobase:cation symporter-1